MTLDATQKNTHIMHNTYYLNINIFLKSHSNMASTSKQTKYTFLIENKPHQCVNNFFRNFVPFFIPIN